MAQIPRADKGAICPFHKKDVSTVCHKCPLYIQLRGTNPNTGQDVDNWKCSLAWLPMLMIENSQQTRQAGAAIESFRNETVKSEQSRAALLQKFIESKANGRLPGL